MASFLTTCRRGTRGALGLLLALHLGVAQAAMVPSPSAAQGAVADAVDAGRADDAMADAMDASPCHHAAAADGSAPATATDPHRCDAGQCHCPIFMAAGALFVPQVLRVARRLAPPLDLKAAPSQQRVPDLRPPIAA